MEAYFKNITYGDFYETPLYLDAEKEEIIPEKPFRPYIRLHYKKGQLKKLLEVPLVMDCTLFAELMALNNLEDECYLDINPIDCVNGVLCLCSAIEGIEGQYLAKYEDEYIGLTKKGIIVGPLEEWRQMLASWVKEEENIDTCFYVYY